MPRGTKINSSYRVRRALVIEFLGGKCCRCDFSDSRALQVDHINGGGRFDERILKKHWYVFYDEILSGKGEGKYQLLCANCNAIKRYEFGEFPKGIGKTLAEAIMKELKK